MCNLSDESKQFEMTPPSSNLSSLFPTGRAVRNPLGKVYFVVILKGKASTPPAFVYAGFSFSVSFIQFRLSVRFSPVVEGRHIESGY